MIDPSTDHVELVLATKENTNIVGWLITDSEHAVEGECSIPFYETVKEGSNFPEDQVGWKDQCVVRQARISWRDDTSISWMERHMEMTQGFMLVGKAPGLMVLGEPTHDRDDLTEDERCWPDMSRAKGYIIPPGCGIIIKKGTWHDFPVSVGPDLAVFIINTKEVIDALTSMKEPAPMDFGDCYKVRMSDRHHDRKVCFPDPRPFVASLGLLEGSMRRESSDCSTSSTESNITTCNLEVPLELTSFEYGQGMTRAEVGKWGGLNANKVWVVPIINVESFVPNLFGPSVQPHLNKAQPELANRGWRDYGNRRGLKRLGRLFGEHDIPCTAVVSSDLVDNNEVMSLLHQFKKDHQWEIGAHGSNNSNAGHAGLSETEEVDSISTSLERLGVAFQAGDGPKTWLTPGFSVTNSTPRLLAEAGVDTLLDFVDDDVPFKLVKEEESSASASRSKSLVCLPYSMETNDFSLVLTRHLSPREYAAALESHISQLAKESAQSGTPTVVCLGMHTFVAGTPASVNELDKVFSRLKGDDNVHWATAQDVTDCVHKGDAILPDPDETDIRRCSPDEPDETDSPPSQEVDGLPSTTPPHSAPAQISNSLCVQPVRPSGTVKIEHDKVGLLLIDFQNDFMKEGGFGEMLGNNPSKLRHIIKPTREVLSSFRKAGLPVIHTREGHRPNLLDVTSLKAGDGTLIGTEGRNGRSMVRGQWGNDIISELKPLSDGSETVIDKPGKGAFYQTDLELVLKNSNIDTLIVCGVTTEVCVHSTVREANDRGVHCIVLDDCTASYFDEFHRCGIEMISSQGGILGEVSDSKSVLLALNNII